MPRGRGLAIRAAALSASCCDDRISFHGTRPCSGHHDTPSACRRPGLLIGGITIKEIGKIMIRRTLMTSVALLLSTTAVFAAEWTPAAWATQKTLQFRADCPDEGEYWSYVWLVVLDNDVYVRLGTRSAGRVDCSRSKPMTAVRIDGETFDNVEMIPSPAMTERVAAAMSAKYPTDLFLRYLNHPYTMKLVAKGR